MFTLPNFSAHPGGGVFGVAFACACAASFYLRLRFPLPFQKQRHGRVRWCRSHDNAASQVFAIASIPAIDSLGREFHSRMDLTGVFQNGINETHPPCSSLHPNTRRRSAPRKQNQANCRGHDRPRMFLPRPRRSARPKIQFARKLRKLFIADKRRAHLGQVAFGHFRETVIYPRADNEIQHGIAEKFKAFVIFHRWILIDVGTVGQSTRQQG